MTADMALWTREMRSLTRWIAGLTLANTVGVILGRSSAVH
jgi:ABC-type nitrate/sulfonate/bicarbonate transport system permease component